MGATDACLFGVVLIIFAYAIAFGFVYQPTKEVGETIPKWMQIHGVRELKHALIEVIIVYLVVDFVTDLATGDRDLVWQTLVKPVSIVLIGQSVWKLCGQTWFRRKPFSNSVRSNSRAKLRRFRCSKVATSIAR